MVFPWFLGLFLCSVVAVESVIIRPTNMLTATNTTKPGCERKCGNITVPYPFGIGSECSIEHSYSLKCNTSYNPPKLFFANATIGSNILNITETTVIITNTDFLFMCFNSEFHRFLTNVGPPYFLSNSNKLTIVGCDIYGSFSTDSKDLRVGCLAACSYPNSTDDPLPGYCQVSHPLGSQITIPHLEPNMGMIHFSIFSADVTNPSCGIGFFTTTTDPKKLEGMTSSSDFVDMSNKIEKFPVEFDWSLGLIIDEYDPYLSSLVMLNCSKAKEEKGSYGCGSNTDCIDSHHHKGYHCKCMQGYQGNPYLPTGCQDIDECASGSDSPCSMVCVNTVGSYNCSCPTGYYGDGFKSGTGCIRINISKSSSSLFKITLGLGVSLGTILMLFVGWWLYSIYRKSMVKKQRDINFKRNGDPLLQQYICSDESIVANIKFFTPEELDIATDHFNDDRIIGRGGQGTVYKGMLSEGRIVAIKKCKVLDESQVQDFVNEVFILSKMNHRNIVKVLGCCLESDMPLLVYEFIPNGTLSHHIHNPSEEFPITWRMRLQIASDSASALSYLHSSSSIPILHRDIKSSNILLDEKYRAKLSDFGTSKSIALDQTHVTTRVMGTFGYLDPEYFRSSQFTEKSDVYSFGVVLIELLTGQKAIRVTAEEDKSLVSWFLSYMSNSRLIDIIDARIIQEGSNEEFNIIGDLAQRCLDPDGKRRPAMKDILLEIEGVSSRFLPLKILPNRSETELDLETSSSRTNESSVSFNTN